MEPEAKKKPQRNLVVATVDDGSCPICWEEGAANEALGCGHKYCRDCLERTIVTKVEVAEVEEIYCPGCDYMIQYEEVKRYLSAEMLARFERYAVIAFVRSNPQAKWCPHPGCDGVIMASSASASPPASDHCPTCDGTICPLCVAMPHPNLTCKENQQRQQPIDSKTERQLRRMGAQNCPNCGVPTIRTTGCRDMRCQQCHTEWQWQYDPEETWVESGAFFYPRLIKYLATSREAASEGFGTQMVFGGLGALIGLPALPVTLILGLPAAIIYGGRSAKRGISNIIEDIQEKKRERDHRRELLEEQLRAQRNLPPT